MKKRLKSSVLIGVAALAFFGGLEDYADAAENESKFSIAPLDFRTALTDTQITFAPRYDSAGLSIFNGYFVGLTFKLPLEDEKDKGNPRARMDEFATGARIGATVGLKRSRDTGAAADNQKLQLQLDGEWGINEFAYYPSAGDKKETVTRHSFAVGGSAFYLSVPFRPGARTWAMQLRLRYAREYNSADKIGIVTPATANEPALVEKTKVVDGPTTKPAISARLFFFVPVVEGSSFAIGPSVGYVAAGPKGDTFKPVGDTQIVRTELWLFYRPKDADPANLRVGVAPMVDWYVQGEADDGSKRDAGLLFQVRFGAPIQTY